MGRLSRLAVTAEFCFCLFIAQFSCCHAGKHYCPVGYTLEIDVTIRIYQDERIIPSAVELESNRSGSIECRWVIKFTELTAPRPLLFQGLQDRAQSSNTFLHGIPLSYNSSFLVYQLHAPEENEHCDQSQFQPAPVTPGLFRVQFIKDSRSFVSVSFTLNSHESHISSPIILRALMPQHGFCSRDMLSFRGNCHAVSRMPENVTATVANIKGDAQLASFSSLAQINEFIAANIARMEVHPYRQPLDLSQHVRIGLFYRASDASVLAVVRNESGCVLRPVEILKEILRTAPATGNCGSLKVSESGEASIEFVDCKRPMVSLLSFPEMMSSASVTSCASDCQSVIRQLSTVDKQGSNQVQPLKLLSHITAAIAAGVMSDILSHI